MTVLLLSVLLSSSVTVEFRLLPPGQDGLVEGVGRARYYLLGEYLQLAEFDSELYTLRKDYEAVIKVGETLREGVRAQARETAACQKEVDLLANRSARLLDKWHTCETALQGTSSYGLAPYLMGGAVGAILTVVGTVLIIVTT